MPKHTLKAGQEKEIKTGALYLQINDASAEFIVKAPELGGELTGETSKRFELPNINQVWFYNPTENDIDIKYEVSNIKTEVADRGLVSVANEIVVKRIVEAIQVEANATVDDGTMSINGANNSATISEQNRIIPNGATVQVFAPRAAKARKAIIQLITNNAEFSKIRLGTKSAQTTETQGIYMQGNLDSPSGYELDTQEAIYVHNLSGHPVELAGVELWRA